MADRPLSIDQTSATKLTTKKRPNAWLRLARYTGIKLIALVFAVTVGMYLTILVANMGGYVDEIMKGQIRERMSLSVSMDPEMKVLTQAERMEKINAQIALEEKRLGLDKPFISRSFRFLVDALTLDLGRSQQLTSDTGSRQVRDIILERLPATLVLMTSANFLLFFLSLFFLW